jgi:molecular chaperone DnaK
LSDDEIAKAKDDAEKFAEDDKVRRELVESKNKLEQLTYQMENLLDENKDKLPDETKEEVNKLIAEAKEVKAKEDVTKADLDTEIERIQKEFQDLYQKFQAETKNTG